MKELQNEMGVDKKEFDKHLMDESKVDPIQMLIEDHNHVKGNFESFEQSSDEGKEALLKDTLLALVVHTKLEEELIYPLMKKVEEDLIGEAEEEHHVVDFVITELKSMTAEDEKLDAKFKLLGELVKHHIKEEEGEMFPRLKKQEIDFEELARKMIARKRELKDEFNDLKKIEPVKSDAFKQTKPSSRSPKSGTTKKTAAKKSAVKKSGKATTSGAKTSTAKKSTAKKKTTGKSTAKKSTGSASSKKSTAKESTGRSGLKKSTTKKATGKSSPRKSTAKKSTGSAGSKKSTAKKLTGKTTAKKATHKAAGSSSRKKGR